MSSEQQYWARMLTVLRKNSRCALFALGFSSTLLLGMTAAAHAVPQLGSGLYADEVITLWGAPAERVEYESSRREQWIYSHGEVLLREGRVQRWSLRSSQGEAAVLAKVSLKTSLSPSQKRRALSNSRAPLHVDSSGILEDIQRYASSPEQGGGSLEGSGESREPKTRSMDRGVPAQQIPQQLVPAPIIADP